jgi:hypothetical protein
MFATWQGNAIDGPPGALSSAFLFGFCPLVLATASVFLGNGGYAVLRGERVEAVVEKVSEAPRERAADPPRVSIDRLSDPATKEAFPLPAVPWKDAPDGGRSDYGNHKVAGFGDYKVGDRVPVLAVRGTDHPVVLVEQASVFTMYAAIWLVAWLTGLAGAVAKLGPRGRAREIAREPNVEVRRTMIERYGLERYLRAANATKLDEVCDPPFPGLAGARLWRAEMAGDEPLCIVELHNSTPEPDGSTRSYMLRVPPDVETAHQAVAWTFAMGEREYRPAVES